MSDLFADPISDASIDSRARYFRECAAMLDHFLSRGLDASPELLAEVKLKAAILDVGIERRNDIAMGELIELHSVLARAISPALPSTIELLSWDKRNSRLNWLAPIPAIRWLIGLTILSLAFVLISLVDDDVAKNYGMTFLDPDNTHRAPVAIFFASLAALGACFSVLYDARKYVVEGTYDPRIGSNYIIRIILGIVSGLILTQLLFDSTSDPAVVGIGKPVVALLGGFGSQFVYDGLKRMVDSLRGIFDPSQEQQLELRERQLRAEAEEKAMLERVARSTKTMNVVAGIQASTSEAERSEALKELVQLSIGDTISKAAPAVSGVFTPAHEALTKARSVMSVGELILEVLPGNEAAKLRERLNGLTGRVDDINHVVRAGARGDVVGMAAQLMGELTRSNPARNELLKLVRAISNGPAGLAGLAGGPVGLSMAVLTGTFSVGSAAYDRWKTRILNAPYSPDLLPPGFPDDAAAKHAIDAIPELAAALGPDVMDDPAALSDLAIMASQQRDDEIFSEYGGRFGAGRDVFDAAIGQLRLQLVGNAAAPDVPRAALEEAGATDAEALFKAIDMIRSTPEAAPELEKLFLLAARARDNGDEAAIRELKQILTEIGEDQEL